MPRTEKKKWARNRVNLMQRKDTIIRIGELCFATFGSFCFFFYRCECYDYLFDVAVSMKKVGLDPTQLPVGENGIV